MNDVKTWGRWMDYNPQSKLLIAGYELVPRLFCGTYFKTLEMRLNTGLKCLFSPKQCEKLDVWTPTSLSFRACTAVKINEDNYHLEILQHTSQSLQLLYNGNWFQAQNLVKLHYVWKLCNLIFMFASAKPINTPLITLFLLSKLCSYHTYSH